MHPRLFLCLHQSVTLLMTLLCTSCGGNGGKASQPASSAATPAGQVIALTDSVCRGDTVRFGLMHSGEIAVKPLLLHNRTERPIVLTGTTQNCGCVSLEYDPQPIKADERRAARLIFDARGIASGWQFKSIDLHKAGEAQPTRIYVDVEVE